MDFSLTTLFVLADDNVLPTAGSTQDLTPGQFGWFMPDHTPAAAGPIATAKYVYAAQGRIEGLPLGTKKSDKIYPEKIIDWYKISSQDTAAVQVTEICDFNILCDDQITITLRLFSSYINNAFFNGLTRSVTSKAPCCECGDNPCDPLGAADVQAVVDDLVAKINAEPMLGKYVTATRTGAGATSCIRIEGKPLDKYGNPCDIAAFPHEYDRMYFYAWAHKGPDTTQDYIVDDPCDMAATVTVIQRATYLLGSSDEIRQNEIWYYSYQTTHKHLFRNSAFNGAFTSYVVDGTFYDMYVVKFYAPHLYTWAGYVPMDETVLIAVPTGSAAATALETLLTAAWGAPHDFSPVDLVTTTIATTTAASTTTTTTLVP